MVHEVKIPELGESINEGTIVAWLQEDGAYVEADTPLLELETDKVTMEIVAPHAGRLEIKVPVDSTVTVGQVVGTVDADAAPKSAPAEKASDEAAPPIAPSSGMDQAKSKLEASDADVDELSPAVRRLVVEEGLDPAAIPASGPGGRLTKEDVLAHQKKQAASAAPAPSPEPSPAKKQQPSPAPAAPAPAVKPVERGERQTRKKMSKLRARIAERLVSAQHNAAMLTTFNEADMSKVMAWRKQHKDLFKEKHGVGLGFMSFFVKASVDALMTVPGLNAQIDGDEIVQNHFYDIGVAVGTEQGLIVPVIRDCDAMGFADIEKSIGDVARRARDRKIKLEELSGGCFTISNGGVYGSLLSTPILNPPQSGILGLHAINKRPVVVDDEIVIRPMMYLALTYDHRIVDGSEAVTFLKRIVECIENPERILLAV